jgi:signal transduction histidine kinase
VSPAAAAEQMQTRPQLDLLTQYLEVNFDSLAVELSLCLPAQANSIMRRHEAASHLRLVIRRLRAERAAGGNADTALEAVDHMVELVQPERALLRQRMLDLGERARGAEAAAPPAAAGAPRSAPSRPWTDGNGLQRTRPHPLSERAGLGAAGVQSVLQASVTKAAELLNADICQFFLDDADILVLQAEAPDRAGSHGPDRLAPTEGFTGQVRAAGRATSISAADLGDGSERAWLERGACHVAAVGVGEPGDAGTGLLVAMRVTPRPFDGDDLAEMARLAGEVALAMASADLLSRAEELAVLKERMNLAREIHDGLASDLSAVVQMFKYHEHRRTVDPVDADRLLVQMRELVEGALQGARDILGALRPRQQTPRRLADTVKLQVEAFSRTFGVVAATRITGDDGGLVAEEREAIYQVLRESLTNIRKHSQCAAVEVTLDMSSRPFVLVVEDDGVGIDMAAVEDKAGSFGILGMRERAQLLGGTLAISNGSMGGARLELHGPAVPLGR